MFRAIAALIRLAPLWMCPDNIMPFWSAVRPTGGARHLGERLYSRHGEAIWNDRNEQPLWSAQREQADVRLRALMLGAAHEAYSLE